MLFSQNFYYIKNFVYVVKSCLKSNFSYCATLKNEILYTYVEFCDVSATTLVLPPLAAAERVLSELYGKHSSAINRDGLGPRESQEKAIQRFLWKHGFTWVQLHLRIHAETQEWSFANTTVPDLFSSFLKEGLQ